MESTDDCSSIAEPRSRAWASTGPAPNPQRGPARLPHPYRAAHISLRPAPVSRAPRGASARTDFAPVNKQERRGALTRDAARGWER